MKRRFLILAVISLLVFLQTGFVAPLFGADRGPDIVLMFAMAAARVLGFEASLGWSVVAGLVYDTATFSKIGFHVLPLIASIYLVSFFSRRLVADAQAGGILLMAGWALAATLLLRFSHALYWQKEGIAIVDAVKQAFSMQALFSQWFANFAAMVLGIWIIRALKRRFAPTAGLVLK